MRLRSANADNSNNAFYVNGNNGNLNNNNVTNNNACRPDSVKRQSAKISVLVQSSEIKGAVFHRKKK